MNTYQEHILKLSKELGTKLDIDPKFATTAMMFVEEIPPRVEIPPAIDQITYLIGLHELMHVKHGDTQARPPYQDKKHYFEAGVLREEAFAWDEAIDLCITPIEDASRYFMWNTCLGSYYLHGYKAAKGLPTRLYNGNRHHVEFVFDEPDSYFTSIVKKIQGELPPDSFSIKYNGSGF